MMRSILNLVVALASAVINLAAAALGLLILIILYAMVPIGLFCWSTVRQGEGGMLRKGKGGSNAAPIHVGCTEEESLVSRFFDGPRKPSLPC